MSHKGVSGSDGFSAVPEVFLVSLVRILVIGLLMVIKTFHYIFVYSLPAFQAPTGDPCKCLDCDLAAVPDDSTCTNVVTCPPMTTHCYAKYKCTKGDTR